MKTRRRTIKSKSSCSLEKRDKEKNFDEITTKKEWKSFDKL